MEKQNLHQFAPNLHKKYLLFILNGKLPSSQSSMDTNRSVLMYFAVSGLDILGEIHNIPKERRKSIIDWIYSLQVVNEEELVSGFQGSTTLNTAGNNTIYKWAHIANTYSCLVTLLILGDDLKRVNKQAILDSLKTLQQPDGSFKGAKEGVESDMRFVYCAASICYILDDWSCINMESMIEFILNSISYDGGIGQGPELESHCGSTFCAVASLALSKNLDRLTKAQFVALRRWLLYRFDGGFNGRPNKPIDTCYSFWTGGALKILDAYEFIQNENNDQYVLMTQDRYGGFSKWVNVVPDPMHTYLGLAGLSLMGFGGLTEMYCELNITTRTFDHLIDIQGTIK
ncbi:geranylgeranyl transferase type-1 subunit beta [Diorhabda carinulata]|uniref:geranylgeranyl transferase type-1 subunit beta n=1 Tax=Diorhabda sublineata TaxID=1163346 RepID=UPI0024E06B8B|nr:geranylgeranyl transferase type-1 subunit beta [Diorhabda sublineata]XP_057659631.1 geranylgeranyl transferase type-1 subunit beta [Diorhabda carinulata]